MKKALLIYNPLSGNRNLPRRLDYVVGRFIEKDILLVPYRMGADAEGNIVDILKDGDYSLVVISGGDGTVNSIINIMNKNGIRLPIGLIPAGTCNDFARSLNIPLKLKSCLDIILEGNIREIDAGYINRDFYFLNTCAGGNFVDVSYSTNSDFKKNFGSLAYYIRALGEMANIRSIELKITTDHEVVEGEFLLFLILNGRHAAGLYNVIKDADLSDGYMDILLLHSCPPIEMAGLFFKAINNDYMHDKNVTWLRTKSCMIEGSSDFILSIDGEKWRELPISVDFIHKMLKVYAR